MGFQAGLVRLVVIGADHQRSIGPHGLGMLNQLDRFTCGIGPGTGNDRDASGRDVDAGLNHLFMFCMGQCR